MYYTVEMYTLMDNGENSTEFEKVYKTQRYAWKKFLSLRDTLQTSQTVYYVLRNDEGRVEKSLAYRFDGKVQKVERQPSRKGGTILRKVPEFTL